MSKPDITLVLPGLEWNGDWLQQDLITHLNPDWINEFYARGTKQCNILKWTDLLGEYVLDISLLQKIKSVLELDIQYGIIVSPVSQSMRLHQMSVLCGNDILDISQVEAQDLCKQLSSLYQTENYHFHVVTSDLWVLETPEPLVFDYPCPYDLVDLVDYQTQATGRDANKIQLLQSEIQMFLYDCSINRYRDKNIQFQINDVWFWNDIPSCLKYPNQVLLLDSDDFAWLRPESVVEREQAMTKITECIREKQTVVFFCDVLYSPNRVSHFQNYSYMFSWLGENIVKPILDMQKNKLIGKINLVSTGENGGIIQLGKSKFFASLFKKIHYQGKWI